MTLHIKLQASVQAITQHYILIMFQLADTVMYHCSALITQCHLVTLISIEAGKVFQDKIFSDNSNDVCTSLHRLIEYSYTIQGVAKRNIEMQHGCSQ